MRRSRLVLVIAAVVATVGVGTALGLRLSSPARAAVGPLPGEALALPAEANVVGGFNLRRLLDSPFYAKFLAERKEHDMPEAMDEFQERTGINPETDVDQIVAAGWKDESGEGTGALVALGRFDVAKISALIESKPGDVTSKKVAGSTMYTMTEEPEEGEGKPELIALSFLGDGAIVIGEPAAVETTIGNFAAGSGAGLEANAELLGRVASLRSDATFWVVGDATALSDAPQAVPMPGGGAGEGGGMKIPPLKSLSLTGDFDPAVAIELVGEAADAEAAKQLADMLRGLVAFGSMQAAQKPELQQLATAISVTTEELFVRISARFPYELIESLKAEVMPGEAEAVIEAKPAEPEEGKPESK